MPQETNLNVAPYFDDFDPQSNYYSVLFKPAYPVQARELNNLQSILQNQVEQFGNHVFKEGAKVIPGQTTYLSDYQAVQIEETFLGVPVSLYLDQLVGKTIKGATSGVTAKVVSYITNDQSDNGNYTLYVNYFDSASTDDPTDKFLSDEVLNTTSPIQFATTFITSGEGFAKTLTQNSTATGSAFAISNGVYFLRGHFVNVYDQILILDQYSNKPSYRIGFNVREEVISSDVDPSLNDNAQGFSNYTAPGADRFKITASLAKKDPDDFEDTNFIQLAEVQNGILRKINSNTEYNYIGDEMARRTFDESGHYYVKEFVTSMKDSLNDGFGNRGIYTKDQKTMSGNTPSEDLGIYKIGAGKAYVRGYEVDILGPTYVDVKKPRTTKLLESQGINFGFGPTFVANRVYGSPAIGFNNTNTLSLRDQRVGSDQEAQAGKEIGVCRVYDFALESGSYDTTLPDLNQWDLSVYDVQTYTEFEVSESVTLNIPTYIKGENSGATAYLRHSVVGTGFTAYDVKGEFFLGERLTFNGTQTNARTVTDITNFETSDVKSVYGIVGSAGTFTADLVQSNKTTIGIASISAASGGISTVNTPSTTWPGISSVGNLVEYSVPTNNVPSLARITQVNTNTLVIQAVEDVPGYRVGALPTSVTNVTDFKIVETKQQVGAFTGNTASGNSLYSIFPKTNIESVDTTSSTLNVRRSFTVNISGNATGAVNTDANEVFLAFDEERYTLTRSDGSTEALTQDKFNFSNGNTTLIIKGLGSNDTGATLVTTISKDKVTSKIKQYNVNQSIIVNKSIEPGSGAGSTTLNDGLTYGNYPFGTRVQDSQISLNTVDAGILYAVYQSNDTNDPTTPSMTTGSLDGPTSTTNDLIVGDQIVGKVSGATALYFEKKTDTSIDFIYQSNKLFTNGEVVEFVNSGVSAVALNITKGSKNIIEDFTFSNGQNETFYDISRIKRRKDAAVPNSRLKICFTSASYDSSDDGDITTVQSYKNMNYRTEVPSVDGIRCTDLIDCRPRVSNYTVGEGTRSPFEFFGRTFNGGQHSSKDVIASDETIVMDFSYYLPRKDRVYLNTDGVFTVKTGIPDDNPSLPDPISNAMNIANIAVPAYLYNVNDATVTFVDHKRYQMSDISKLEKRIANLEYYTSLSQLETNAVNQFVPDANGLDRFKSGIFVDNFASTIPQDPDLGVRNSVDRKRSICRPSHYTTAFNLELGNTTIAGIGTTTAPNQDKKFADILGTNVRRNDKALSLDYTEQVWLKQQFATRVESVTPYMVTFWAGNIVMNPDTDVWIDVNQMEVNAVEIEGSFESVAQLVEAEITTDEDGNRIGVSPIHWGSWETTGINVDVSMDSSTATSTSTSNRQGTQAEFDATRRNGNRRGRQVPGSFQVEEQTTTTTTTTSVSVGVDLDQQRTGEQFTVIERVDTESLGEAVVSREVLHFMRARNVECISTSMKPFTKLYAFFDSVDVNSFCYPKLLEVQMETGTFQVGETVTGVMPTTEQNEDVDPNTVPNITFRVATLNHKYGPYNEPTDRYDSNPYNRDVEIGTSYSETSTILNIDTSSLEAEDQPEFAGWVAEGMILRGGTSGAEAVCRSPRLVTDRVGTMIYVFQVPPSGDPSNPTFETGQSRMRLTSSETNSQIEGTVTTSAEATFYSQGTVDNTQETTLSIKNADVEIDDSFVETRTLSDSDSDSAVTGTSSSTVATGEYTDPLAQSFVVDDPTGVFITSVDVYFQGKPEVDTTPVTCQIRTVELGTPTKTVLPFANVDIDPRDITLSEDASVPHNIKFKAPVFLEPRKEYAIILLSHNTEYRVFISQLGEPDISTLGSEEGQILVSTQPTLGSLFKSQNASTWTPSQYEDLTYTLYRADFAASGSAQFFNPNVPKTLEKISKDNLTMYSRELRVSSSAAVTSGIEAGNTITQDNTGASGKFAGFGGPANGSMSITQAGVGYTGSAYTFTGVALTSLTGTGINATANITINNGGATSATINAGGIGYQVGDILEPISIGNDGLGVGMKLSVSALNGNNELVLTGVQGRFTTNSSDVLRFENSLGSTALINGGGVYPLDPIRVVEDGHHANMFFRNHGMHALGNVVTISGLEGEVEPTTLTEAYSSTSSGTISVGATTNLAVFEGVGVGATNPGYVKVGSEVIQYTGFSGNTLTGITRGVDNTPVENHSATDIVKKYEMNGVSLRRINKNHNLNATTDNRDIGLDTYGIKIDMSDTSRGTNRTGTSTLPQLFFNQTKSGGGRNGRSTYNVQFEMCIPNFTYVTPTGTTIEGSMRTTSGTSVSGVEPSFFDKGFSPITFKKENYFDSPRIIASKVNEDTYLDELPGNKSMTLNVNMATSDSRLSPMIDLERTTVTYVTNRVNDIVTNYADDPRVNSVPGDPSRFIYATKPIVLENPSTSIQVLLDAYLNEDCDLRVFYAYDQPGRLEDVVYIPFPGFSNQDSSRPGAVLNPQLSDGTPDVETPKSDRILNRPKPGDFREHKYTVDFLPAFTSFRIKIVATTSNQAVPPQFKNLRVSALA